MQFKYGTKVFTSDGRRVGTLDRIVIEPGSREITHLVVQKGFLFTEDKVIPMELVGSATEEQVTLRKNGDEMEGFPDFIESHYVSADRGFQTDRSAAERLQTSYWYPPLGSMGGFSRFVVPEYAPKVEKTNIPEETVALADGADVISSDGKHVGDIERIFADPEAGRATHILISDGLLLKEKKLIPARWVTDVLEEEVHLSVDSELLDSLPEYQIQA